MFPKQQIGSCLIAGNNLIGFRLYLTHQMPILLGTCDYGIGMTITVGVLWCYLKG